MVDVNEDQSYRAVDGPDSPDILTESQVNSGRKEQFPSWSSQGRIAPSNPYDPNKWKPHCKNQSSSENEHLETINKYPVKGKVIDEDSFNLVTKKISPQKR